MRFTTKDKDNDLKNSGNCALDYNSGWWYNTCQNANPNGLYEGGGNAQGLHGRHFEDYIFFKAHRDQNSTSMTLFVVVASLSRQQTVASN